jgi:hypothetical protein
MEHYSLALSLDPKNEGALSGLHRMEAGSEGGLEASYDMEMAEIGKHSVYYSTLNYSGLRIRDPDSIGSVDPDPYSLFRIRIPIQEGKNDPQK